MSLRAWLLVPGLISAVFAAGCGGSSAPDIPVVPVGGTLLVDGKPLNGVEVTFIPIVPMEARTSGDSSKTENLLGGRGTTDESGAFTITGDRQEKPGLPPGKYTVIFSRMTFPDGSVAPKGGGDAAADTGLVRVESLPANLTAPNESSTEVEISKAGNAALELKISTK